MSQVMVVWVTAPDNGVAEKIAKTLVDESLAACVNIMPAIRSIYRWEDKVQDEPEVMLMAKSTADRFDALAARVKALHPYSTPEIIAAPIVQGDPAYLRWVRGTVES